MGIVAYYVIVGIILVICYFIPAYVALKRRPKDYGSAIVINVFLGMTGIGWALALAMACRDKQ